ncbi:hypothetical protein A6R70_14355 [Agrobacterium rubi]|uniref:pyocin knob domain-containing protein n=1 Tax=Agrobacterium rubi TaxID=28099 RepID=UPI00201B578E|nr:pyocin knob domain-containing protein [Agrobacterium rubi]MCL6653471.1 hypothetical protein [Agrobacterium rubi]
MTTPYVTGTVSVTAGSAIVTGVGTGWLTSGLVAGQFGLDSANGNPVPVLSIDSDTQITLAKPWRGTSANGQGYWITYDTTPGQQTVANAQRLAEYIARLDKPALAALASLVPAADKLPYFGANGAGALADFNAAARALLAGGVLPNAQLPNRLKANLPFAADFNDCRETGFYYGGGTTLNIPVAPYSYVIYTISVNSTFFIQYAYTLGEIAQGRTGEYVRECSNGTFTSWLRSGRPERGSNTNGEYVRFADGTQICWRSWSSNFSIDNSAGPGLFRSAGIIWNLPVLFTSKPLAFSTFMSGEFDVWCQSYFDASSSASASSFVFCSNSSKSSAVRSMNSYAIGRWY